MAKRQLNRENKGPTPRGGNSLPVFQLGAKFGVIAEFMRVGTKPGALAAALDITERKITDAAAPDTSALSPEFEQELVDKLKVGGVAFDPKWPQWSDPRASKATPIDQRADTADAFKKRLSDENPRPLRSPPVQPGTTSTGPVAIAAVSQPPVESTAVGLAAVSLNGQQPGKGTMSIEFTLACGIWQGATISHGVLRLMSHPGLMTNDAFTFWRGKTVKVVAVDGKGKDVDVVLAFGGTAQAPHWRINAIRGQIGTLSYDPSFAALENLSPGNSVTLTFGTWLCDIDEPDDLDSDGLVLLDAEGKTERIAPEKLSQRKRRLVSIIRKSALDAKADGFVDLAHHTLMIVEKQS